MATRKATSKSAAVTKTAAEPAKTTAAKKTAKKSPTTGTPAAKSTGSKAAATKSATKKTAAKKTAGRKYSSAASAQVGKELHEMHRGHLRSGSGQKVTNPKQAIAIGLSEARRAGKKVPPNPNDPKKK